MVDYSSSNNYLMLIMLTSAQSKIKYTFYTKQVSRMQSVIYPWLEHIANPKYPQAQQIAQQMKDYMVIGSSSGNKRRKSVEFNLKQQTPKQLETRTSIYAANNTVQC